MKKFHAISKNLHPTRCINEMFPGKQVANLAKLSQILMKSLLNASRKMRVARGAEVHALAPQLDNCARYASASALPQSSSDLCFWVSAIGRTLICRGSGVPVQTCSSAELPARKSCEQCGRRIDHGKVRPSRIIGELYLARNSFCTVRPRFPRTTSATKNSPP